ncbi:MAG: substrate-binding domain-containing protein [Promicromonosporaceae bacterium]|nr:substrate-binding domain-containing protein [Promicromonosporaceae bacterium]
MNSRPTLATVAELAGVSRQTVSNVISNPHLVAPITLERVRAVIAQVDYRPNTAARRLRTQRSFVVGARMTTDFDGISGYVLDHFLHAVTSAAQRVDLHILLYVADDAEAEIQIWDQLLAEGGVDGLVLAHTHADDPRTRWLSERKVPFVAFGRPWNNNGTHPGDHAWVDVDGCAGVRLATERLLELGHRRIAFLGWPEGSGVGDDRLGGYLAALAASDQDVEPLVRRCDGTVREATEVATELLADPELTAIVTVSDSLALGASTAVRECAPRQVAIVGFDDTPVARALDLSSVAQPVDIVADHCIDFLRAQIDAANARFSQAKPVNPADRQILIQPRLVERASSRSPN